MDLVTMAINAAAQAYKLAQSIIETSRKKGEMTAQQELEYQADLKQRTSQDHWKSKDV